MSQINIANINALQDAMKNIYLPVSRYQMDERTNPFIAQLEKKTENVKGTQITRHLRIGRNGGAGMRTESGNVPVVGTRRGKQIITDTKNFMAAFEITDKAIKATQSSAASYVNQLTTQMEELLTDSKDLYGMLMHLDETAVLGKAVATGSANAVVQLAATTNMNFFSEGMILDVLDAATKAVKRIDAKAVVGVDRVNKKITFESNVGSAITDNDVIVPQGSYNLGYTGVSKVMTPDTVLYGLDRNTADYKWMNPNVFAMGGELDELKMDEAITEARDRSGEEANFIVCSNGVERAYKYLWQTLKRNVNRMDIKGGWNVIEFNNIPLVPDKLMPAGTMHLLNTDCFQIDRLADWEYVDQGGGILTRKSGTTAFEAVLTMYSDLICDKPGAQSTITGITEH